MEAKQLVLLDADCDQANEALVRDIAEFMRGQNRLSSSYTKRVELTMGDVIAWAEASYGRIGNRAMSAGEANHCLKLGREKIKKEVKR